MHTREKKVFFTSYVSFSLGNIHSQEPEFPHKYYFHRPTFWKSSLVQIHPHKEETPFSVPFLLYSLPWHTFPSFLSTPSPNRLVVSGCRIQNQLCRRRYSNLISRPHFCLFLSSLSRADTPFLYTTHPTFSHSLPNSELPYGFLCFPS